ncbi:T9SS type A sorting domain-containing protein [Lewinella sp. 4G2]|uniref:T9SS type A sorting domain-containing protein n=1 Tax=Lewinella sp. 4G2 TaxID=1803372 RepID=UPI0007B4E72B|nr:T9SS type A sorting domain-containing protein [Lewinella sp. 4G2]OAV44427.1 hypothetical protein A3850_007935 [Lewinella sp. 4G2]
MKQCLLFLLLLVSAVSLSAQEELTANYFPVVGDTLRTTTADSAWAAGLDLQLEGGMDLSWDFSDPVPLVQGLAPVTAPDDDLFPAADLVITQNLFNRNYYRTTANALELVGTSTRVALLPDFGLDTPVSPAIAERRTGVSTGDAFDVGFDVVTTLSPDSIPAEALALLPEGALAFVDSIRLTVATTRTDVYDADGVVLLDETSYPVLREKRLQSAFISVEVRLPFVGYTDIAAFLGDDAEGLGAFLGQQDTVVTYLWWNNDSKEPIAEAQTSNEGDLISFQYKQALESTSTSGPFANQAEIMLYPNPVTDYFSYKVEGVPAGRYYLSVVNILGREMLRREFTAIGDQTKLTVDVAQFPAGTYVASLRNDRGLIISSRKMLVR